MAIILTDLSSQPVRALPKPRSKPKESAKGLNRKSTGKKKPRREQKVQHNRGVPKQRDRTKITPQVANEVLHRADGKCEMCGRPPMFGTRRTCLELAHLEQRSHLGRGDHPWNIAALCGPGVNNGTCHFKIDSERRSHRDWVYAKIDQLKRLYDRSEWPE